MISVRPPNQVEKATKPFWITRIAHVLTLVLLAPIIVDVLPGATRITMLFGLIAEIATYGSAALLIRWLVCSRGLSSVALMLLGIAFAIAEECIFLQTSLTPAIGVPAGHVYGYSLGVSWLYLLWAIGYECVWSILIPIQLVDLLFPSLRKDPWFGSRGFIITCIAFVLGAGYAWYYWTQVVLVRYFHKPASQPPFGIMAIALLFVTLMAIVALRLKAANDSRQTLDRAVPWPWLLGTISFLFGLFWYIPLFFNYGIAPSLPFIIPLVGGILLAVLVFFLYHYWSASTRWQDRHRLACISGALVACMLEGCITLGAASPLDVMGKVVINILALIGLFLLAHRVKKTNLSKSEPLI